MSTIRDNNYNEKFDTLFEKREIGDISPTFRGRGFNTGCIRKHLQLKNCLHLCMPIDLEFAHSKY